MNRGVTLIETMVSILTMIIVVSFIFGAIVNFYQTRSYSWDLALAVNEARLGIKTMTGEIREAQTGDNGAYPIELASDKEFIFYGDIDKDGAVERVRYFIGTPGTQELEQDCLSYSDGGSCSVTFSDFYTGNLVSASLEIFLEGDLGWDGTEYGAVMVDGDPVGNVCYSGCTDCAAVWQDNTVIDVTEAAADNYLDVLIDATSSVGAFCDWQEPNHSIKARVELSWTEETEITDHELKKGTIDPDGSPLTYNSENEEVSIISSYIRNGPVIFEYFDENGDQIIESPARLSDTKAMRIYLVVNVNEDYAPDDVEIESYVQLRNLKDE